MIGYVLYGEDEDDPSARAIGHFMIAKESRRKRYGKEVLKAVIEVGREKGFRRFVTSTAEKNEAMRSLFTRLGFETNMEVRGNEIIYFIEE